MLPRIIQSAGADQLELPDISGPAHRTGDAVFSHQPLEWCAGILAALIGMMQPLPWSTSAPNRHNQGVRNHLGRHLVAHGPSDNTPREKINDGSDIEPAFHCPDVGEVRHPFLVRAIRIERTSRMLAVMIDLAPSSFGGCRHFGRALTVACRINRATHFNP